MNSHRWLRWFCPALLAMTSAASLAQGQDKVTVTIAGFGGNDVFAMNTLLREVLAQDFADANIDVDYFAVESDYPKYILNALSSGNAPDAFYVSSDVAHAWIGTGKLAPLSSDLQQHSAGVVTALRRLYQRETNLYGIPKDLNALALQYNVDVFDDAKVEYPRSDDTWPQFKQKLAAVVHNLGDEGVTGLCIEANFNRFAPFAFATGWQPFDQHYHTRLDANFQRAFEFYTSLLKDGLAVLPADLGQQWGGGCFAIERTAVTIEGSWLAGYLRDRSPNLLYDTVLLPVDPNTGQQGNLLFTAAWAVNKDSAQRQAAQTVVKLLTGEKAQAAVLRSGLAIPSDSGLNQHPYFAQRHPANRLAKAIFDGAQVEQVHTFAFGPYGNGWMEPIQIALSSVLLGQLEVPAAIAEAQNRYDQMYRALQAKAVGGEHAGGH